jgi:hypothetical protein
METQRALSLPIRSHAVVALVAVACMLGAASAGAQNDPFQGVRPRPLPQATTPQPLPARPAPAANASGSFDGIYRGTYRCGPIPGTREAPFTTTGMLTIRGTTARFEREMYRPTPAAPSGSETATGRVSQSGEITLSGTALWSTGAYNYQSRYQGHIVDDSVSLEGSYLTSDNRTRLCSMQLQRQ